VHCSCGRSTFSSPVPHVTTKPLKSGILSELNGNGPGHRHRLTVTALRRTARRSSLLHSLEPAVRLHPVLCTLYRCDVDQTASITCHYLRRSTPSRNYTALRQRRNGMISSPRLLRSNARPMSNLGTCGLSIVCPSSHRCTIGPPTFGR